MGVKTSKTKTEGRGIGLGRVIIKCRGISKGKEWTDDKDPHDGGIDGIAEEKAI